MDEFVSVQATQVGRDLKSNEEELKAIPRCIHCGAPLKKPLGTGETVKCDNCGQLMTG